MSLLVLCREILSLFYLVGTAAHAVGTVAPVIDSYVNFNMINISRLLLV